MKILAVIPARAGSKTVPNKNIRLLNGHPMVYYAINNAIRSSFINDVVVTTDSPEVEIIAKQLGGTCHWRNENLCKDDVTLDEVVYDAVKSSTEKYDYIITLQVTSPTLKVETLDKAISYTIENNFDTVISTVNAPHLSWKELNGKKIPNYEKRLNRQYLPKNFVETGAFLITKSCFVTENSRFGKNIDVFEVSEEEAIDIDTFIDFYVASKVLKKKRVAIYVNGNNLRGTGHIYRVLELADEFMVKPDIYFDINQTDIAIFGKTTHNLKPVNGIVDLYKAIKVQKYDLVINDILSTSLDYMIGLRTVMPENGKIVNFEDLGEGSSLADLVFNALFTEPKSQNVLTGEKYYIAPKLFLLYNPVSINDTVRTVFISFGGADPQNYTDKLLNIISKDKYCKINFIVVLGRVKKNVEQLLTFNNYNNIHVYYDVRNMPELMSKCDISVTSRGRTAFELAILGIPSIVLSQNVREENHSFVCDDNGFTYLGTKPSDHAIESTLDMYISMPKEDRQNIQNKLNQNDLKNGRKRIMNLIENL